MAWDRGDCDDSIFATGLAGRASMRERIGECHKQPLILHPDSCNKKRAGTALDVQV